MDQCVESFAAKLAPSVEDTNTSSFFALMHLLALKASLLVVVNVTAPRNSTKRSAASFGCRLYDLPRFSLYAMTALDTAISKV